MALHQPSHAWQVAGHYVVVHHVVVPMVIVGFVARLAVRQRRSLTPTPGISEPIIGSEIPGVGVKLLLNLTYCMA